ncbi:MAG: hypothetical protein ACE5JL_00780 [Dehalococcoidia bacterium]
MEEFLPALLQGLERRCRVLTARLTDFPADPDVRDHALGAYQMVESIRREVVRLLADPSLGAPTLLPNHLQEYRRWNELARLVESYPLPFIERYSALDQRLTRLCRQLLEQVGWPLPHPLVAAFSREYYWTLAPFSLICTPATEGTTLLGLSDLCHELGHILLLNYEDSLIGDFRPELVGYIERERQRVDRAQRPPQYHQLYDLLLAQWRDEWLREFVSDMVATYLTGPAFAWQHVRLCVGSSEAAFHPSLGEMAEHPAEEARLSGMLAVLERMNTGAVATRIRALWDTYLSVSTESRPAEYDVCYPQTLIDSLARRTIEGCQALGLRSFGHLADSSGPIDIPSLISEAWERFMSNPQAYFDWEHQQLDALWQELGVRSS